MAVNPKLNECVLSTFQKLKGITKEELQQFADEIDRISSEAEVTGMNPIDAIKKFMLAEEIQLRSSEKKRLLTMQKNMHLSDVLAKHGETFENFDAIVGANTKQTGEYQAMWHIKERYKKSLSGLFGKIESNFPETFKLMKSADADFQKNIAMFLSGKKNHGLDEGGVTLAQGIRKAMDFIYEKKKMAGFDVSYIDGYIGKQRHPLKNLVALGEENWIKTVKENFTFSGTDEEINKILKESYKNITEKPVSSFWDIASDFDKVTLVKSGKTVEANRKFQPKSLEHFMEYNKATGQNYFENLIYDFEESAGEIAAGMTFGPNYKASVEKLLKKILTSESKKAPNKYDAFVHGDNVHRAKKNEKISRAIFEYAVREKRNPAVNLLGRTAVKMIQFTNMVKLSSSIFSVPSDWAQTSGVISSVTGESMSSVFVKTMLDYGKNFAIDWKGNGKAIAQQIGVHADDMLHEVSWDRSFEGAFGGNRGIMDRVSDAYMKMTGLGRNDVAMKRSGSKNLASQLEELSKRDFKDVNKVHKEQFARFQINESNFHIIKNASEDLADGTKAITIENLDSLDLEMFQGKTKAEKLANREKLVNGVYSYLVNISELSVPNNDLRMKTWMASHDINTVSGAAMRFMMQYKTYPIALMKTSKFILETGGGKYGNIQGFAKTASLAMVLSTMSYTAKKVFEGFKDEFGETTHDPSKIKFDTKAMIEIALRSGVGGIYADMVMGDRPFVDAVAGPALSGPVADLFHLAHQGKNELIDEQVRSNKGFRSTIGQEAFKTFQKNFPALPYTKSLMQKAFFENVKELVE